jgi:hypothetical protein
MSVLTVPELDDETLVELAGVGIELPEAVDPYKCADCMALGDACEFHRGYGDGFDDALGLLLDRSAAEELAALAEAGF